MGTRIRLVGGLVTVLLACSACSGSSEPIPPAINESVAEATYLDVLTNGGITFTDDAAAVDAGRALCDYLDTGGDELAAIDITMTHGGYSAYDAGYILGAATGTLCPEHVGSVQ